MLSITFFKTAPKSVSGCNTNIYHCSVETGRGILLVEFLKAPRAISERKIELMVATARQKGLGLIYLLSQLDLR
tara:strand:- start:477620 stop:477841 length:222 start_codon:yes stop_codon:yes gene_type:complete